MREQELASLMIQAGLERGIDVEQVVEELLTLPLPSFVDSQLFRSSLLTAVEAHLQAQLADRMRRLRKQFGLETRSREGARVEVPAGATPPIIDKNATVDARIQMTGRPAEGQEIPGDATMVWTTYPGRDSGK